MGIFGSTDGARGPTFTIMVLLFNCQSHGMSKGGEEAHFVNGPVDTHPPPAPGGTNIPAIPRLYPLCTIEFAGVRETYSNCIVCVQNFYKRSEAMKFNRLNTRVEE